MMQVTPNPIRSICIVGGGTAGWMAAALLSNIHQGTETKITLVESPDIATIGVGEATVPSFMAFLSSAKINPKDFIEATAGTFKLGIRFDDWYQKGHHFLHPFGKIGRSLDGHDFYQLWLKTLAQHNNGSSGDVTRLMDHSPSAIMAEQQRFMVEAQLKNTPLENFGYALHLDAVLAARYLRELSIAKGVVRVEATVNSVQLDARGFIDSITLANGENISADFFIDCSGFKGLLIEENLQVGYEDWSEYLPCNRAVAVQTENIHEPAPFTIATARAAGWTWKIPLQHRTGNGYVFASDYCSDDEATQTLLNAVEGRLVNEPRIISFVTGKRKKIWHNNCLALGLASGFLEPLESTAIHLVYRTLVHFIRNYPERDFPAALEQECNAQIDQDYMEVRDFIILHYCTSQRDDTAFWRWCQNMPVPGTLRDKINRFRLRGQLERNSENLFGVDSWLSILEGMHIRPEKYHPLVDALDSEKLSRSLMQGKQAIYDAVTRLPSHGDFIKQACASKH
ncbi:tryptophan halogenase family protein [Cellvibrio sp. pealriver]|uniref:tryptophan halogenase family protein n=1 Tax=Cellvibrio sp. pealriver TaxID=1622269 RepID=UPI000A91A226|nr:tryptophan halogenase family protein [Cellvibrio sp. pealriver]